MDTEIRLELHSKEFGGQNHGYMAKELRDSGPCSAVKGDSQ